VGLSFAKTKRKEKRAVAIFFIFWTTAANRHKKAAHGGGSGIDILGFLLYNRTCRESFRQGKISF
jgi:hypothetical protein